MRWLGKRRSEYGIQVRDDLSMDRADFDQPLPPVTRNELLVRLGVADDETPIITAQPRSVDVVTPAAVAPAALAA